MTPSDFMLPNSTMALGALQYGAQSSKGVTGPGAAAALTGSPLASFVPELINAAFAEDPGAMTFLPTFDGGKIDAAGASLPTVTFGAIQTGGAASSGWGSASSAPRQEAGQTVSPSATSGVSANNFPVVIAIVAAVIVGVFALLK